MLFTYQKERLDKGQQAASEIVQLWWTHRAAAWGLQELISLWGYVLLESIPWFLIFEDHWKCKQLDSSFSFRKKICWTGESYFTYILTIVNYFTTRRSSLFGNLYSLCRSFLPMVMFTTYKHACRVQNEIVDVSVPHRLSCTLTFASWSKQSLLNFSDKEPKGWKP